MKQIKLALFIIFQMGLRIARLALMITVLYAIVTGDITTTTLFNLLLVILIQLELKPITVTQHIQAHDVTISGNEVANMYGAPCKCSCGHGADQSVKQPGRGKKTTN